MRKMRIAGIFFLVIVLLASFALAEAPENVNREEYKTPFPVTGTLSEEEKKLEELCVPWIFYLKN